MGQLPTIMFMLFEDASRPIEYVEGKATGATNVTGAEWANREAEFWIHLVPADSVVLVPSDDAIAFPLGESADFRPLLPGGVVLLVGAHTDESNRRYEPLLALVAFGHGLDPFFKSPRPVSP
jgi:hypothetical protein